MRVVRVWVERVNEISRTKFVQGFECTKAAVLSPRSGCLLRTVVPIETDFFSERLCVVMSRLPWRRLCPWLQRSTSRSTFHWICDLQPMYYCWWFLNSWSSWCSKYLIPLFMTGLIHPNSRQIFRECVDQKDIVWCSHRSCMPKTLQWSKAMPFGGNTWLSKCVNGLHFPTLGLETGLETEMGKTAGTYCTKT